MDDPPWRACTTAGVRILVLSSGNGLAGTPAGKGAVQGGAVTEGAKRGVPLLSPPAPRRAIIGISSENFTVPPPLTLDNRQISATYLLNKAGFSKAQYNLSIN